MAKGKGKGKGRTKADSKADAEAIEKDVMIQLEPIELKSIDLFEARVEMQNVVSENIRLKQDSLTVNYRNHMAGLKAQLRATSESAKAIKAEHNKYIAELESKHNISLKDYSIEPDGVLIFNPLPDEDQEPDSE